MHRVVSSDSGNAAEPNHGEIGMNWDQIEGQWRQVTRRVKSTLGNVTDDDVKNVAGKRRMLIGKLQARYGVLKDDAEKQFDGWMARLSSSGEINNSHDEKVDKSS